MIRGGLNYVLELRWDGVPTLRQALAMLREQAARTPKGQWVRVVGGWSAEQFAEKRLPTVAELNAAAPDTPVFVLHLYQAALMNRAALKAAAYTKDTPDPRGGQIVRGRDGEPTGMLLAAPSALILYSTLAAAPVLQGADLRTSTRHFLRELNRFGLTSAIDAAAWASRTSRTTTTPLSVSPEMANCRCVSPTTSSRRPQAKRSTICDAGSLWSSPETAMSGCVSMA